MPSEGVVDVLRNTHRAIRPGAPVLDLQPEIGDPPVEIVKGGRVIGAVPQDESWCARQIASVRTVMDTVVGEGLFVIEQRVDYEWLQHATTIEEWVAYRALKAMTPLADEFVGRLRAAGADQADEIRKRERCTATLLSRLP